MGWRQSGLAAMIISLWQSRPQRSDITGDRLRLSDNRQLITRRSACKVPRNKSGGGSAMKIGGHILLLLAAVMMASPAWAQTPPAPSGQPAAAPSQPAPAVPTGPVYVVTYFDVDPAAVRKTSGLLRQFAAATRKEDGNVEFSAVREMGRPGRYAILEGWRDKAALEAHGAAMKSLAGKLQPGFASPFDARQFLPLAAEGKPSGGETVGAIWVLTHIDVFPTHKDETAGLVKEQVDSSRKDSGVLRYDALVWDGHPNHFQLLEVWANRGAQRAHESTEHTKAFRAKLVPLEGAFYDERLYEALR
jgi:quinol monooxygenase YgiN